MRQEVGQKSLKTSDALLSRSQSDLHNVFQCANLAILILDKSLSVRLYTAETARLFGIGESDVGQPISALRPAFDYPGLERDVRAIAAGHAARTRETRLAGTNRVFEVRLTPYRTLEDELDGCILTFVEITHLKRLAERADRQRRKTERQYAELMAVYSQAPFGLSLFDTEMRYVRVNARIADLTGLPVNAHVGWRPDELFPRTARPQIPIIEKVLRTGERETVQVSGHRRGDETQPLHVIVDYFPVHHEDEIFGVACIVRDVAAETELRREKDSAFARLAESEMRFRELLGAAPFAIGIHAGPEHVCVFANDEFRDWHLDVEPIGSTLAERCGHHENNDSIRLITTAYETGLPQIGRVASFTGMKPDGTVGTRYYTGVAQPYQDDDGKIAGVMTMTIEVTEEQQWRQRQELLVSEMRHRVKNLLAIVQAVAAFSAPNATDKNDLLERLQDRLEAIGRANSQLIATEGRARPLHDLIAQELEQLGPDLQARVHISGLNPELPAATASVMALALHELTNNAVKHGAFSTPYGTVDIRCEGRQEDGGFVLVWREHSEALNLGPTPTGAAGFGLLLLTNLVARETGAEARLDFTPPGIVYEISFKSLTDAKQT